MKCKIFLMFLILFLLIPKKIHGSDSGYFANYGLGFALPEQKSISESKFLNFGYQNKIDKIFDYRLEVGGWNDASKRAGRSGNGYIAGLAGLEPKLNNFYLYSFHGLSIVAKTDSTLGSWYQFVHEIGFGFYDNRDVKIGVNYMHFSNAGIKMPNHGRDFITIRLQIPCN